MYIQKGSGNVEGHLEKRDTADEEKKGGVCKCGQVERPECCKS